MIARVHYGDGSWLWPGDVQIGVRLRLLGRQVRQGWPKLRQPRGRSRSVACRLQQMQSTRPRRAYLLAPPILRKKRLSKFAVCGTCAVENHTDNRLSIHVGTEDRKEDGPPRRIALGRRPCPTTTSLLDHRISGSRRWRDNQASFRRSTFDCDQRRTPSFPPDTPSPCRATDQAASCRR